MPAGGCRGRPGGAGELGRTLAAAALCTLSVEVGHLGRRDSVAELFGRREFPTIDDLKIAGGRGCPDLDGLTGLRSFTFNSWPYAPLRLPGGARPLGALSLGNCVIDRPAAEG